MALALAADFPALEALDDAWSPHGALRLLNEHVVAAATPGRTATAVTVDDVSHVPGRACTVHYIVGFDGERPAQRVTATFAKDDRLTRVFEDRYDAGSRGGAPVVLVPERRCLVEFFGMDWQLPALARAADPAAIAPVLERLGCGAPLEIDVLRYRPHQRCVLRYRGRGLTAIGKVFRHAEDAARVWRQMRALRSDPLVPAPLALVERTLLLVEHVSGRPWLEALARAPAGAEEELVRAAAAAAATLHGRPARWGEPRTFASELAQLRRRIERMAPAAPALAAEAGAQLDRLAVEENDRLTLVHGDFKPDQLVVTPDGVVVLDLDRVGPGDPAVDLGNFIAQLHREAVVGGRDRLRRLAEPFLAEYERLADAPGVADRARSFRALALVRMAVRRFVHFPHLYARGGASSSPAPLLAEARACLE
jgi:aminoglycoside phosphotransferase (APT) family kinase protein